MKKINQPKVNDIKTLKKSVSNTSVEFEKGDKVKIIGVSDRGYDLVEINSGEQILECGWDIFED